MGFTPAHFDEAEFDHSWFDTIVFVIIKCVTYITKKLRLKSKTL